MFLTPLITRAEWGALDPTRPYQEIGNVKNITVHRTETRDDDYMPATVRTKSIQRYHMKSLNFTDIGYHLLIGQCGEVLVGRPLGRSGAHAKGHNRGNIGVAVIGEDRVTAEQRDALVAVLDMLVGMYDLKPGDVHTHGEFNDTDCPGATVLELLDIWRGSR